MKPFVFLFSLFWSAFPAWAEEAQPIDQPVAPQAMVSLASVSLDDCRRLVGHAARPDATYQAGVDVRGNPVVPAEGQAELGQIQVPDEIVIDFGLDLAGRYGIASTGLMSATAGILFINYDLGLGALTINGKPLNRDDSRAVAKACAMMVKDADGPASAK